MAAPFVSAALAVLLLLGGVHAAGAQSVAPPAPLFAPPVQPPAVAPPAVVAPPDDRAQLNLSATLGGDQPATSGLSWSVFGETPTDGKFPLVARSAEAAPSLRLPSGDYVVHVAYGLASAVRRVSLTGGVRSERLAINAGGLRVIGLLGDQPIPPDRLTISVFVPEGANPQGKLVARDVKPERLLRLPEGTYHLISTYLDAPSAGAPASPTNSIVDADVRIQPGKTTEAMLRHRAALMTLKLVNAPGGEALANTSFTVLTPGGDVIREMIGAFPSLVLAEGEYVAIARRDGRTYQGAFTVRTARDRDVEIMARDTPRP